MVVVHKVKAWDVYEFIFIVQAWHENGISEIPYNMVVVYKVKAWHGYGTSEIPYNRETKCERQTLRFLQIDLNLSKSQEIMCRKMI